MAERPQFYTSKFSASSMVSALPSLAMLATSRESSSFDAFIEKNITYVLATTEKSDDAPTNNRSPRLLSVEFLESTPREACCDKYFCPRQEVFAEAAQDTCAREEPPPLRPKSLISTTRVKVLDSMTCNQYKMHLSARGARLCEEKRARRRTGENKTGGKAR